MNLTTLEKIKVILVKKDMNLSDLAELLGQSKQNFHNKVRRNDFRESELIEIANALGVDMEIRFTFENGDSI